MLERIRENIRRHGYHLYLIGADLCPRFIYTIGLSRGGPGELLWLGAASFSNDEALTLVREVANQLLSASDGLIPSSLQEGPAATSLSRADDSWVQATMLGAVDYLGGICPPTYQVVAEGRGRTLDVPDARSPSGPSADPVWKWLLEDWTRRDVDGRASVVTNLEFLRGARATQGARWEVDEWEVYAGPSSEIRREDVRVVSVATALGIDSTLEAVFHLDVNSGLRRSADGGPWETW